MKINLPVILLRGLTLLPNNELRLEFENDESKNIIDVAEMFHDDKVLVVSQINPLEEVPKIEDLPKVGVVAKIKHKLELPNKKMRVVLVGSYRASILEYLNMTQTGGVLESIVSKVADKKVEDNEEYILVNKIYTEVEKHVKVVPYISNSILGIISDVRKLSKITDIIAAHLTIDNKRMQTYLNTFDSKERAKMIIEDLDSEREKYYIETSIDNKVRKGIEDNQKEYLLREKMKVIREELGDISSKDEEIDKIKSKIENLKSTTKIKERLYSELRRYESLSQNSPEMNVVRNYIDWLLDLPWKKYTKDNENLRQVKLILDNSHYGLDKVKERIIEYLAVKKMARNLKSPILCLVGPPGVGKTSLAFSVAKAIDRKFVKISVGGLSDEAELLGHRKTYLGSSPGKIIQSLKKAKSSNPVFLIDEIDKMRSDIKGDPASAMLEILDPEQNKHFADNYIEEEYDLSSVMFIATANYIEDIPSALKDRLEIVNLSGYTEYEKLDIAKKHLMKKIARNHGIHHSRINIKDEIILKIIRNYTKESGVRELERLLSTIVRKVVYDMVINEKTKIYNINQSELVKYLGQAKYNYTEIAKTSQVGLVNGLAYTYFGGDTLPIEVNLFKGTGKLVLTGYLGEIMRESAQIALSYIKSNAELFNVDYEKIMENDIHIHAPEGAVPKDGPSAGVTLTTALLSALTGLEIPYSIAMTGEITLRGQVLEIGGLKEKSIGALRSGIKEVIIPYNNKKDLEEIPKEITDQIKYIPVKNYMEIYKVISEYNKIKLI